MYARAASQCLSPWCVRQYSTTLGTGQAANERVVRFIRDMIKFSGPISIGHYMKYALLNPTGGYYMKKDVFGAKGDFVTSPECSSLFGKCLGEWYLQQWERQGKPKRNEMVEFGPGRGTLLVDMLTYLRGKMPIEKVHIVEPSHYLRKVQEDALSPFQIPIGWHENAMTLQSDQAQSSTAARWIMLHEVLDALPIFMFKRAADGSWQEVLVTLKEGGNDPTFQFCVSPEPTAASRAFAPPSTYKGDIWEACPESVSMIRIVADLLRLSQGGGGALVIDYGGDQSVMQEGTGSLRGIKDHQFVHPLSEPGEVDLSADVDFGFIKRLLTRETKLNVEGPTQQADFLSALGIKEMMRQLHLSEAEKTGAERIIDTGESGMGKVYKVLTLTPKREE